VPAQGERVISVALDAESTALGAPGKTYPRFLSVDRIDQLAPRRDARVLDRPRGLLRPLINAISRHAMVRWALGAPL
jgi:hypothetical protein